MVIFTGDVTLWAAVLPSPIMPSTPLPQHHSEVSLRSAPPIQRGLERFLDAVRTGDPGLVACTVEQAAGTLEVALACERALAGRGRVTVES